MIPERKKSTTALVLSVIFHILILGLLLVYKQNKPRLAEKAFDIQWVDLATLEQAQQWPEPKQIVQQDDESINDEVPEKDYKLSKNNQDVVEETKAAKNGALQNRPNMGQARQDPPEANPQPVPASKQKLLSNLKPSLFDNQYSAARLAAPPQPALSGTQVSQNDDYLKDVAVGAESLLKTREFVYYAYYNRIKQKLRQHWEPRIKQKIVKILKQGRRIATSNDKMTRLVITLDQKGQVKRIQVKQASGYNDLDDAAIEAFRAAAPFPNPPHGIVGSSGEVEISWDFVLET